MTMLVFIPVPHDKSLHMCNNIIYMCMKKFHIYIRVMKNYEYFVALLLGFVL